MKSEMKKENDQETTYCLVPIETIVDFNITPISIFKKIEKNRFELDNIMEEAYNFIKGKCLVFDKNERERNFIDNNDNKNRIIEIKQKLSKINEKFMEIDGGWEETRTKEDLMVIHDDIDTLRKRSLDVLNQKDNIIDKLVECLHEDLLSKSSNETEVSDNNLVKLNKTAKNKIKILNEEYKEHNLAIKELMEDETNKRKNKDLTEWELLMDKCTNKRSNLSIIYGKTFRKKDLELMTQYKTNEDVLQNLRTATFEKYTGMNVKLELIKRRCLKNIEKLKHNCDILKNREEGNVETVINRRKRIFLLQETVFKMSEKCKKLESDINIQVPILKKQITNINKRIDEQAKKIYSIIKRNNSMYQQLWYLQRNNITRCINYINQIDYFVHQYLGTNKMRYPCEKSIVNSTFKNFARKNTSLDVYGKIRDNALNKLLLDFITKNSSFTFDYNFNNTDDTDIVHNLPYAYNALSALNLNEEKTWNLMKSKLKPLVVCIICKSRVNWESGEMIDNSGDIPERKSYTNTESSNCTEKIDQINLLYGKLYTHINQHNLHIDNVKKSKPLEGYKLNDTAYPDNITEKQNNAYSINIIDDENFSNQIRCVNVHHELSIDNKYFMSLIKETLSETNPSLIYKSIRQNVQTEYKIMQSKNEKDLREYWSQFKTSIQSSVDLWNVFDRAIERYHEVLIDYQRKCAKAKIIQKKNEELKKIKYQIECYLSQPS